MDEYRKWLETLFQRRYRGLRDGVSYGDVITFPLEQQRRFPLLYVMGHEENQIIGADLLLVKKKELVPPLIDKIIGATTLRDKMRLARDFEAMKNPKMVTKYLTEGIPAVARVTSKDLETLKDIIK